MIKGKYFTTIPNLKAKLGSHLFVTILLFVSYTLSLLVLCLFFFVSYTLRVPRSGDGKIEYKELHLALRKLRIHLTEQQVISVMRTFDKDGDGVLDLEEFEQIAMNFDVDINGMAVEKFKTRAVLFLLFVWTMLFAMYFSLIEQVSFLDGIWFTICTFTTIGLGDVTPSVQYRWIAVVFIFFGLGFVSMFIDSIVTSIRKTVERRELALQKLERDKISRRMKMIESAKQSGLDKDGDGNIDEEEWLAWEKRYNQEQLEKLQMGSDTAEEEKKTVVDGVHLDSLVHEKGGPSSGAKSGSSSDVESGSVGETIPTVELVLFEEKEDNVVEVVVADAEEEEEVGPVTVLLDLSSLIENTE